MRKFLATALLCLFGVGVFSASVQAQSTRGQILAAFAGTTGAASATNCFPTNGVGSISGATMRACMTALVNSISAMFGDALVNFNAATVGTATGGSKGAGSINAAGNYYVNGAPITASLEGFSGATADAKLVSAIALGYGYVTLAQSESFFNTTPINLPFNFVLDCQGYTIFQQANVSPSMLTMADQATIKNCRFNGEGQSFTGDLIGITAGNNQRLLNVDIANTAGFNLNIAADAASNFAWIGGSFNRTTPTLNAIEMPASELGTSGNRRFVDLVGNGSWFMDTRGANLTIVEGVGMSCLTIGTATNYLLMHNSRPACAPTINGTNGQYHGVIFDGGVTIGSGAQANIIEQQNGLVITDSSGNNSNMIVPMTGNTYTQYMSGDGLVGWTLKAATNLRLSIGTLVTSAIPYIRTNNSLPLNIGVNSTDYWQFGATGIFTANRNAVAAPAPISGTIAQFVQADATLSILQNTSFGTGSFFSGATYGGTNAAPTAVTNGSTLVDFNGFAYNGSGLVGPIGSFRLLAGEAISAGHQGSQACIYTTPTASTTLASGLCQNPSGGVTIGSPTGGDKGIGTLNGVALYVQGVAVTGAGITALTGDGTATGPGSAALTLATVNANVGGFGSSTAIPNFTVNAKGLITAAGTNAVIAPAGTLTGATLAAGVTASSLTSVGTIGTGVWQGTVVAGQYGGSGVANTGSTFTRGGNVTFSGAFAFTGTLTNTTTVTFPTSGTLAALGGTNTWTAQNTFSTSGVPVIIDSTNSAQNIQMKAAGVTQAFFGAGSNAYFVENSAGTIDFAVTDDSAGGTVANYLNLHGVAASSAPRLEAAGTDTNIDLKVSPKGTGVLSITNASSFTANGAVATVLGSIGPTGSHTTVQKWLTLKDSGAVVGYIPIF